MKVLRIITVLAALLTALSASAQQMADYIEDLASATFDGRRAGTEGEKEAAQYMSDAFSNLGIELLYGRDGDPFGIKGEAGDTLISRNVAGVVRGYDRELKDHYIVIGARLDNLGVNRLTIDGEPRNQYFLGANGNASGLAMLLGLAHELQTNAIMLRRSVVLVAFGASLQSTAGSWYFINRSFDGAPNVDAMINLDMLGTGTSGFYAYTASNPDLNNILDNLRKTLQPAQPELVAREPVASDHRAFYDREIPSVFFTSGMYPEYNTDRDTPSIIDYDAMDRELEYIFNFTLCLANGPKPMFRQSKEVKKRQEGEERIIPFSECDVPPTFLGSTDPVNFLKRWVYTYLRYPEEAVKEGIQGRVLVDFVIDEKGKMKDVRVLRGVHPLLDEEAVRVVSASPDWKPARHRGQKVKSQVSMYVEFKLKKR